MAGTVRKLGLLLISKDAVSLDTIATSILGLNPADVRHIPVASSRGLGKCSLEEIETIGLEPQKIRLHDFKFPKVIWQAFVPRPIFKLVYKIISLRPKIINEECQVCGKCVERCPVKAMAIKKGKVTVNYKLCIGCLCCQELCSSRAIKSTRSRLGEILMKGVRLIERLRW
jgi:Pyruvate/2-oxoacid:ferredoxin oxidoreductase delta subunit